MTTIKTKPQVINYLEYNYKESKGEINTLPSETIPNQAFTVSQVLTRFSQGTLPNIVQPVYYDDNDDFDNDNPTDNPAFDFVDADNILSEISTKQKERNELKKQISQQTNDKSSDKTAKNDNDSNDDKKQ